MHLFSGKKGCVFALGEPFLVHQVPLSDCGTGWDWCSSDGLRCWEGEVCFEVWDGDWEPIEPLGVFPRSGMVSFSRCLKGLHVRASGTCCPTSLLLKGEEWRLQVETAVRSAPVLSSDRDFSQSKNLGATAHIDGVVSASEESVFAYLPFGAGVFVGAGKMMGGLSGATVSFNDEGVVYEPA